MHWGNGTKQVHLIKIIKLKTIKMVMMKESNSLPNLGSWSTSVGKKLIILVSEKPLWNKQIIFCPLCNQIGNTNQANKSTNINNAINANYDAEILA